MDPVFLARIQFAATTIFHFFFVPLSIGLSVYGGINGNNVRGEKERDLQKDGKVLGTFVFN